MWADLWGTETGDAVPAAPTEEAECGTFAVEAAADFTDSVQIEKDIKFQRCQWIEFEFTAKGFTAWDEREGTASTDGSWSWTGTFKGAFNGAFTFHTEWASGCGAVCEDGVHVEQDAVYECEWAPYETAYEFPS